MSALTRKIALMISDDLEPIVRDAVLQLDEILKEIENVEIRDRIRERLEVLISEVSTSVAYRAFLRWKNVRELELVSNTSEIIKDVLSTDTRYNILMLIENARCISKKDLAVLTGLSSRTVSRLVKELIEMGYVKKGKKKGTVEYVSAPWEGI